MISFTFCVKNDSEHPITIKKVEKSCDCHNLAISRGDVISPRATAEINFSLSSTVPGAHEGWVSIETDASDATMASIRLVLKGKIKSAWSVTPRRIEMRYGDKTSALVSFATADLLNDFLTCESAYGVVKIDRWHTSTSARTLSIDLSVQPFSGNKQIPARDVVVIRLNNDKVRTIMIPVSIVAIRSASTTEVVK